MSLQHLLEPLSGHNTFDMVVTLTSDVLTWDNRLDVIVQQTTVVASDELLTQGILMGESLDVEFVVSYILLNSVIEFWFTELFTKTCFIRSINALIYS